MKSIEQLMRLDGRGAIVTGGAGHIGLAICETLLELGANVTIFDVDTKSCRSRCDLLNGKDYFGHVNYEVVDLSDEKKLRKAVNAAAKKMGGVDIIVHSAAFVGTTKFPGWVAPFPQQSLKAWQASMKVNLEAAFAITQEAYPYLKKSGHGSVIYISSIHGLVGPDMNLYSGTKMGNPAAYGASKAGLIQLARYFGTLFGPDNIRANCISPGGVWRNQKPAFHVRYKKRTPAGRMATEEDMKGAIAYLAGDLSAYVTGQNLVVDGGYTAW